LALNSFLDLALALKDLSDNALRKPTVSPNGRRNKTFIDQKEPPIKKEKHMS